MKIVCDFIREKQKRIQHKVLTWTGSFFYPGAEFPGGLPFF